MNNYTVYEIYDLTNAPTITKRKIAHGGDLHGVAREVCGKSLYLSAPSIENGRAIIRIYGTDAVAYVIAPEGIRNARREQKKQEEREAVVKAVKRAIFACGEFDGKSVTLDDLDIDHAAKMVAAVVVK